MLANGVGIKLFYGRLYQRSLDLPSPSDGPDQAKRKDFELVVTRLGGSDEPANDYRIDCMEDGNNIGHLFMHYGNTLIPELGRELKMDGWYIYDVFVRPDYRGRHLAPRMIERSVRLGNESGRGHYAYAIIEYHYLSSARSFGRSGFNISSDLGYLGIGPLEVRMDRGRERSWQAPRICLSRR